MAISLSLLVAFAAALRLYRLDHWSLWLDETAQYQEASKPLGELYLNLPPQELPISLLMEHALIWLGFDQSNWQLRLPAVIFGVAVVVVIFLLARELFCRRVAWFSGLVACVMPLLVIYSQENRSYSLIVFLTALSGWSLAVALKTNRIAWWCLFAGATILGLFTHFVMVNQLAGLGIFAAAYVMLRLKWGEPVGPIIISSMLAFGIVAVAFLPGLPMLAALFQTEGIDALNPHTLHWDLIKVMFVDAPGFEGVVSLFVAGLAVLGIVWSCFCSPRAVLFLVATLGVPALILMFHGHDRVAMSPRYVAFMMPSYAVAAGAGLAAISFAVEALALRRWPGSARASMVATAALTLLVVLAAIRPLSNVYATNPKQLPLDLREAFAYVRSRIRPNDLLLEASTTKGGSVYWFAGYNSYFLRPDVWPRPSVKGIVDDLNFPKVFMNYLDMHGRLWVLVTLTDDEQASVQGLAGNEFDVHCFRMICAIRSRHLSRPMLEQLSAFFDRFAPLDPSYFAASARAVRAKVDAAPPPH